jgi:hypothetical protein
MSKSSIRYNTEPVKSTSHLHNPTPYEAPLHFHLISFSRTFSKRSSNNISPQFFDNRTVRKLGLNTWKLLNVELEKDGFQLDGLCEKLIISWHRFKDERNILQAIKRRANWVDHILLTNCFLKHVIEETIEGKTEVTESLGRRCKQLLIKPSKTVYTRN